MAQESIVSKIMEIAIGLLIVAIIIPIGLVTLAGATLTGVDPTVQTVLLVLLPILAILGIALYFMPRWK